MVMKNHVLGKRHQALAKLRQSQQLLAERSIFVRGFPFGTSDEKLKKVFSNFGEVCNIILNKEEVG
jgi:RNA recognition motif-containing protein